MKRSAVCALFLLIAGMANASVRDFGAKGDGVADDTAAFQKAMDECGKSGGGVVEVPTGRYLIKTSLSIPPSVTLEEGLARPGERRRIPRPEGSQRRP